MHQQILAAEKNIWQCPIDLRNLQSIQHYEGMESAEFGFVMNARKSVQHNLTKTNSVYFSTRNCRIHAFFPEITMTRPGSAQDVPLRHLP